MAAFCSSTGKRHHDMLNEKNQYRAGYKEYRRYTLIQPAISANTNGQMKVIFPTSASIAFPVNMGPDNSRRDNCTGLLIHTRRYNGSGANTVTQTVTITTASSVSNNQTISTSLFYIIVRILVVFVATTGLLALRKRRRHLHATAQYFRLIIKTQL